MTTLEGITIKHFVNYNTNLIESKYNGITERRTHIGHVLSKLKDLSRTISGTCSAHRFWYGWLVLLSCGALKLHKIEPPRAQRSMIFSACFASFAVRNSGPTLV